MSRLAADIELTMNAILAQLQGGKAVGNDSSNCFLEKKMSKNYKRIKKEIIERAYKYAEDSEYPIKPTTIEGVFRQMSNCLLIICHCVALSMQNLSKIIICLQS